MFRKPILAALINEAVENCYIYGEGRAEDELFDSGLVVTAEWTECADPEYDSIICICIFRDNILKFSYEDPETKCS